MRTEVRELRKLGPLPGSDATLELIEAYERLLRGILPPVTDEEARALVTLFPAADDTCYGLAWILVHVIETAPNWPLKECVQPTDHSWIVVLRDRARRGGFNV
jgi:hypothetical protein